MELSQKDVEHIAALARLALMPDEIEKMRSELGSILGYIQRLNEVVTTDVVPTARVGETRSLGQADVVTSTDDRERRDIISAFPDHDNDLNKVKLILG